MIKADTLSASLVDKRGENFSISLRGIFWVFFWGLVRYVP